MKTAEQRARFLLPADTIRLPDGTVALVNSAHYRDPKDVSRQMVSICPVSGRTFDIYYADECILIHRHEWEQYGPVKRCKCGEVYTTLADYMKPHHAVTLN